MSRTKTTEPTAEEPSVQPLQWRLALQEELASLPALREELSELGAKTEEVRKRVDLGEVPIRALHLATERQLRLAQRISEITSVNPRRLMDSTDKKLQQTFRSVRQDRAELARQRDAAKAPFDQATERLARIEGRANRQLEDCNWRKEVDADGFWQIAGVPKTARRYDVVPEVNKQLLDAQKDIADARGVYERVSARYEAACREYDELREQLINSPI